MEQPSKRPEKIEQTSAFKKVMKHISRKAIMMAMTLLPMAGMADEGVSSVDKNKAIDYITQNKAEQDSTIESYDFTTYFDADNATISPEKQDSLMVEFTEKFLANLSPEDMDRILASEFEIFSSCDERPSSNFENNLELSLARSHALEKILEETIDQYNFPSSISPEKIQKLRNKEFSMAYPEFDGAEPGVIPLEAARVEFGDTLSTNELYDLTRTSVFRLKIDKETLKQITAKEIQTAAQETGTQERIDPQLIENLLSNTDGNLVLFDSSPSMRNDTEKILAHIQNKLDTRIGTFSNELHDIVDAQDIDDIRKFTQGGGSKEERILQSTIQALDKLQDNEKNIVIITDEAFQNITGSGFAELEEKIQQSGATIQFVVIDNANPTQVLSIEEVKEAFTESRSYSRDISRFQEIIQKAQSHLSDESISRDSKKFWEKTLKDAEEKLAHITQEKTYTVTKEDIKKSIENLAQN